MTTTAASPHTLPGRHANGLRIAQSLPWPGTRNSADAAFVQQMFLAEGLRARGHALTFLMPGDIGELVYTHDIESANVAPRTWTASAWFSLATRGSWRMQQLVGMPYFNVFSNLSLYDACVHCLPGHDLVHERNGLYRTGVAQACKRLKLPYVLFFDGDDLLEHDFIGKPITGTLRWRAQQMTSYNFRAADCVVCVSNTMKKRLADVWRVPPEKIAVFPNAADVDRYRPRPETRSEVRASLGLGEDPTIIFVSGFHAWHDATTLFEAFRALLRDCAEARLLLVGDGPTRQATAQKAAELGIAGSVQFTGALPNSQVSHLISAADIAVAPYVKVRPELFWGSPMKVYEYMASGVALVASDQQQITEVVQDGKNGLLVKAGDVTALAAALLKLIRDPELRSALGLQARRDALANHSWEFYVSRLERLYDAVLARRPVAAI